MKTAPLQRLKGEEIIHWMRQNNARTYKYQVNSQGLWFVFSVGMLLTGINTLLIVRTDLSTTLSQATATFLVLLTLLLWGRILRWNLFAARNHVVLTPTHLMVRQGQSAYVLPRHALTPETIPINESRPKAMTNVLPLRFDDFRDDVLLLNLYASLTPFADFVGEMLPHMGDENANPNPSESSQ